MHTVRPCHYKQRGCSDAECAAHICTASSVELTFCRQCTRGHALVNAARIPSFQRNSLPPTLPEPTLQTISVQKPLEAMLPLKQQQRTVRYSRGCSWLASSHVIDYRTEACIDVAGASWRWIRRSPQELPRVMTLDYR